MNSIGKGIAHAAPWAAAALIGYAHPDSIKEIVSGATIGTLFIAFFF